MNYENKDKIKNSIWWIENLEERIRQIEQGHAIRLHDAIKDEVIELLKREISKACKELEKL